MMRSRLKNFIHKKKFKPKENENKEASEILCEKRTQIEIKQKEMM